MDSFAFEQRKMPEVLRILKRHAMKIIRIDAATLEQDTRQATDLVVQVRGGAIGVRVRTFQSVKGDFRDWTVRSRSRGGQATEIDKLRDGWGDFYFYGWDDATGNISEYMIFDLAIVRQSGLLHSDKYREISNRDGTWFIPIPAEDLCSSGAMLVHTIDGLPGKYHNVTRDSLSRQLNVAQIALSEIQAKLSVN